MVKSFVRIRRLLTQARLITHYSREITIDMNVFKTLGSMSESKYTMREFETHVQLGPSRFL